MAAMKWRYGTWVWVMSLVSLCLQGRPGLGDTPPLLELGAFAPWDEGTAILVGHDTVVPEHDDTPLVRFPPTISVAGGMAIPPARRLYLTSIVGGSFLVVAANNSPSAALTGGGALGWALERSNGRIRLEAEGRYRGPIDQTYLGFNQNFSPRHPNPVGIVEGRNFGGWSVLANVWRDFRLSDHVDVYGGGGIGATGYDYSFQQISGPIPEPALMRSNTEFAWQAGVGCIWNVNDRFAVDASYRLFGTGWTFTRESFAVGFPRNEILVSLRIYEPFRGLLR